MKRLLVLSLSLLCFAFTAFAQSNGKAPARPQSQQVAPKANTPVNPATNALVFPTVSPNGTPPAVPPGSAPKPDAHSATPGEYVIGVEDVIRMQVYGQPDLVAQVPVMPDGKIGLPLVNEIDAAGLTVPQLRARITERVKDYVVDPTVELFVVEFRSKVVYIESGLNTRGSIPLLAPITIAELIGRAGGFAEYAKKDQVTIIRHEDSTHEQRFHFNWNTYVQGKDIKQNILLQNKDMIIVSD
jgi:polysaccharide export outer membrane protein